MAGPNGIPGQVLAWSGAATNVLTLGGMLLYSGITTYTYLYPEDTTQKVTKVVTGGIKGSLIAVKEEAQDTFFHELPAHPISETLNGRVALQVGSALVAGMSLGVLSKLAARYHTNVLTAMGDAWDRLFPPPQVEKNPMDGLLGS